LDPIEPVAVADIMIAVIAGALVVLMGALYALSFAFGRLWQRSSLLILAYGCFGLLALNVLILARTLHLEGRWQAVTIALLLGYLLAPHAIWRLSVGTHQGHEAADSLPPVNASGRNTP
jgi:hypothetical protein